VAKVAFSAHPKQRKPNFAALSQTKFRMKNTLLFFCCLFLFAACEDPQKKQVEVLQKETEDLHDVAMKNLTDMYRVGRQLKSMKEKATVPPADSAAVTAALVSMGRAEADMTAWMNQYQSPDEKPAAEAIAYLQEQKSKIEKNHQDILAALEAGKKLLPKN
jgi:hypothetical protein